MPSAPATQKREDEGDVLSVDAVRIVLRAGKIDDGCGGTGVTAAAPVGRRAANRLRRRPARVANSRRAVETAPTATRRSRTPAVPRIAG